MKTISTRSQMLIPAFFLILIAVALPTLITSHLFINNIEQEKEEQCIKDFIRSEERVFSLLSDVYYSSVNLWQEEDVLNFFIRDHATHREDILSRVSFVRTVREIVKPSSNTESVVFIDSNGKTAGCSLNMNYFDKIIYPTDAFEKDDELDNMVKWIGLLDANTLEPLNGSLDSENYLISGIKKQYYTLSNSPLRQTIYILFSVQKKELLNCFSYLEYDGSEVLLLDQTGRVLSGSAIPGSIPDFYHRLPTVNDGSLVYRDHNNEQFHIIHYTMPTTGWTFIKKIPTALYGRTLSSMWRITAIVGIATFVIVFILYSLWVKNFTVPIRNLTAIITDIKNGNMENRVELRTSYSTEMYLACAQFNSMLDSINELLEITENNEREKATLEIKTLQSQITPHFIYNTISSIRYMASLSGAKNVEEALIAFSNIIRPVFSTWQSDWTLREEFQLIEYYVSLMCMRFGSLFHMEKDIDDPCYEYRIPRFLILTLLENSCEHGFAGEKDLHILVRAKKENDMLMIDVEDDGNGIPNEKLEEIRYNISHEIDTGNIGLANLDRRVKLYSGKDCGIHIESEYGKGTRLHVKMRIL